LRYPSSEFEVIVVDDGSEPPATAALPAFQPGMNLRSICLRHGGPARARNAGLATATGEYVVFLDDDCVPDPAWLEGFNAVFAAKPGVAAGGKIVDSTQNNIYARSSQLLIQYLYQYGESNAVLPRFFCSNNLAFPRLELATLRGFDEGFPLAAGEDRDLCDRWVGQRELVFAAEAVVAHHQDLSLVRFLRQHFRYGRGAFHFWDRRKARGATPLRMAPLAFYTGMFLFPLKQFRAPESVWVAILIALSVAANVAGYFAEWTGARRRRSPGWR
jgi:glycosyltransferase involved in cell wall biosynthesis